MFLSLMEGSLSHFPINNPSMINILWTTSKFCLILNFLGIKPQLYFLGIWFILSKIKSMRFIHIVLYIISSLPIHLSMNIWAMDSWMGNTWRSIWQEILEKLISWRRKWPPTLVFLVGKFHGQRRLVGYNLWNCKGVRDDLVTK